MESRPAHAHISSSRPPVLLIGPDSRLQRALRLELHALHTPVREAASLRAALDDVASFRTQPSVVMIPDALIETDSFEEERAEFQIRAGVPRVIPIAIGRRPDEERREALRDAGIRLALFGRFGRHALRFQLNRALSCFANRSPRGDLRAPMEWRTRTSSSGREKGVRCYSLSTRGAYFATPRPWVVGSEITLELPLSQRDREIEARVLYTKGHGESTRPGLPGGMAVTFESLSTRLQHIIERDLAKTRCGLEV
jgi:PilZ domain